MDIVKHNNSAWNDLVDKKDRWTIPVSKEDIENARKGIWEIILTPTKPMPHNWLPDLKGLKVLGLASGGGQQGPIMAALGADVTIFDNSENQLGQDRKVSDAFNLNIKTIQGDMRDLSVFDNGTFDAIFNPCSIVFVDKLDKVWSECYRVLKKNGVLVTGLMNPLSFQLGKVDDKFSLIYKQPYSDINSLPKEELSTLIKNNEALAFGHSLTDQIGGQLKAGFVITNMFEDEWGGEEELDEFFPSFIATRAIKVKLF